MKKLSLVLLVTLLVGILAACAPAATPAPAAEAPKAEPAEATTAEEASKAPEAPSEPAAAPEEKIKVAAIFSTSIKDGGFNQAGYEALMAAKDKYGIEVSFQEDVSDAEIKDVLRNYAADGYDLVIAHELYFTDPVLEVAPDFPDVMFGISGGYKAEGSNVITVTATNWEATYLVGALSGLITKTNKIGIITATESPIAKRMVNSFKTAALDQNPDVKVLHAFTGSFEDVVKGKELARSMIKEGADVIYCQSGQANVGAIEAAQEAGVYAMGAMVDLWEVAPDTVVSSALLSPGQYLEIMIKMYVDGTIEGGKTYVMGVRDGIEDLAPYHNFEDKIPQEAKDKVLKVRQDLIDGKIPEPKAE